MNKNIKRILFVMLMTATFGLSAQTVTLTFTGRGTDNSYVRLNRVVITNLTKSWQETVVWPDTVLTMQNGTGIDDYVEKGGFALSQNSPNPFKGTTDVSLSVAEEGKVQIEIADMNGRSVVETQDFASLQPGIHQFRISMSSAGAFVMTARQNGKASSIKMICNGGKGTNSIDYLGIAQSITYVLKSNTNKPFSFGDLMEYVGYATVNGAEMESQRITQQQGTSQTFTLQFAVMQAQAPSVTTNALVNNVTSTTATCGGNVNSDGGATVMARGVCWSTYENPTVNTAHTIDGSGTGVFTSYISGLAANTTYYVRAYATNSMGTTYGEQRNFITNQFSCGNTTTDYDGNIYNTVQIGSQCWMKENLRTTHYADGDSISQGNNTNTTTAHYFYPNYSSSIVPTYGLLYNWYAVMHGMSSNDAITIGVEDTISSYLPSFSLYNYSLTQQIYTASEIGAAGIINSISFYNSGSAKTRVYNIYVVHTNKESFDNNTDWVSVTDGDLFFSGSVTMKANEWTTISFSSPFRYNGTDNLLLVVDDNTGSWESGMKCNAFSAIGQTIRIYSDGTDYDPINPSIYNGTIMDVKNQIRIGFIVQGICPDGWHVPSHTEWIQLADYVRNDNQYVCGGNNTSIAKALAGTTGWDNSPYSCSIGNNPSSNNATGFSALPAGSWIEEYYLGESGYSLFFGQHANFWSSTEYKAAHLSYIQDFVSLDGGYGLFNPYSIRCLRDAGTTGILLDSPANVTASVSGSQIYVSWSSVSNATSYKVYRSSTANGNYSQIGLATSNTYLYDSSPLTGYNYYKVKAVNSEGESGLSDYASCNYLTAPSAPNNVSATQSGLQIHVTWNSVPNATSYKVYRSSSSSGTYSVVCSSTTNTYWNDNSPLTGYNYYKVKAVNSAGESDYSVAGYCNYSSGTTVPSAPTGVNAIQSGSQIYIYWTSVPNATSYIVYRSSSANGAYSQVGLQTSNTYIYDSSPMAGYNYYRVRAVNSSGMSDYSMPGYFYYNVPAPNPPTNVTATPSANQVCVSWNSDEPYFKVYRSSSMYGSYTQISQTIGYLYYCDENPLTGNNYYKVKAVNSAGQESDYSSVISCNYDPTSFAPCIVSNLSVSGTSSQTLSWTYQALTGCGTPTAYEILKYDPCDGQWPVIATKTTTSYNVPSSYIHPGINRYIVRPINNGGTGSINYANSSSVSLSAPSSFTVQKLSGGYLKFTWSAVSMANGYQIFISDSPSPNSGYGIMTNGWITGGSTTTITIYYPGTSGTTMYFKMKAFYECGNYWELSNFTSTYKSITF